MPVASPVRRPAVLFGCGMVAGFGWWTLIRHGWRRVTVRAAIDYPTGRRRW